MTMNLNQVSPGPCPPSGCPPTTEIVVISVEKVFDSDSQVDQQINLTAVTTGPGGEWPTGIFTVGEAVPCELPPGVPINVTVLSRVPAPDGKTTFTLEIHVPLLLTNPNESNEATVRVFDFTKTVTLNCPEGVEPNASGSTLIFCSSVIIQVEASSVGIACVYQVYLVLECTSTVQLLVPSYGFYIPAPVE